MMIEMTTINSMRVNPRARSTRLRPRVTSCSIGKFLKFSNPEIPKFSLPVPVFGAVERRGGERRVAVEHVLPAPAGRVGFVLVRTPAPVGAVRHRIDRDAPQVLELAPSSVVGRR